MLKVTAEDIARALGYNYSGLNDKIITSVTCDSREVTEGSLFIALAGEKTDGHNYIAKAYENGAVAAVVSREIAAPANLALIYADDGVKFLQELAAWVRSKITAEVIAVTGSYGKTSTKDLLGGIFSAKNACVSKGNNNNEIGLPLTLCRAAEDTEAVITEMGMRGLGQIKFLCEIARPKYAIITNIGTVHSELLGSKENIAKAKCEILPFIPNDGAAVLNWQDKIFLEPYLKDCKGEIIWYNCNDSKEGACALARNLSSEGSSFIFKWQDYSFKIELTVAGEHNIINAMAAIVVALKCGLAIDVIQSGLKNVGLSGMRLKTEQAKNGALIINDSYNANPEAMRGALQVLSMYREKKKIAVLGEMYELGIYSKEGHEQTGKAAYAAGCDYLIAVGEMARDIAGGAVQAGMAQDKVTWVKDNKQAISLLRQITDENSVILVKASRGMQMEEIVREIMG